MNKFLIAGAAAATILVSGAAFAQTSQPAAAMAAAPRAHAHGIRPASRANVPARVAAMFAKLDANHDGFVTGDELSAFQAQRAQKAGKHSARLDSSKIFDRLDLNHDGQITRSEAEAARSRHAEATAAAAGKPRRAAFAGLFARADANKDGIITRAEFDAAAPQIKRRAMHAGAARSAMASRLFDMADAAKDGRVSLAEMQQAALAEFDRLDVNHDGTVTPEERRQGHQLIKAQRKGR